MYGATSAGVCAAVAAAGEGAAVLLLEPGRHVGGMTSGGLGYTDVGDLRVVGGMAARFRSEVAEHYGVSPGTFAGPEPHVAEEIFRRWLDDAGVEVVFDSRLAGVDVDRDDRRIRSVDTGAWAVEAAVFVDASYEGDLLAAAGVPYAVGREDVRRYGERHAGRQELLLGRHAMPPGISPFMDDPDGFVEGPLLAGVRSQPPAPVGSGDGGVMAFGYRVCLTTAHDRIPIPRRPGYREEDWELGRRLFAHWRRSGVEVGAGALLGLEANLPHGKCDANSLGPFSLNLLDGSAWAYPDANPPRREQLRLAHLYHAQDFGWFLGHDRTVPASVRRELDRWGLPPDEFADTGHWPHQLYVREARRMRGAEVLTEHDVLAGRSRSDVVALGSYHLDVREVQRIWRWVYEHPRPIGMVFNEGYLSVPVPAYAIGYRHLVPRAADATNLLVPVCLSASAVAFSSVRMEVQYAMLGHAAGLAAALAARNGQRVQDVDVAALQDRLRDQGQCLETSGSGH